MYGEDVSWSNIFPSYVSSDRLSSLDALITALDNLDDLCKTVEEKYLHSLRSDSFDRWQEKS